MPNERPAEQHGGRLGCPSPERRSKCVDELANRDRPTESEHALEVKFNIARAYYEDGEYKKSAELFKEFAMSDSAFQIQYRQEFIQAFEQHQSLLRDTVTTEAVTLAAGGQRSLMSAYAALQMLLPVLAFAVAARLGKPRQFEKIAPMKDAQ